MISIEEAIAQKIMLSISNNWGSENYDSLRYGEIKKLKPAQRIFKKVKRGIKRAIGISKERKRPKIEEVLANYGSGLQRLHDQLDEGGKSLMVALIAYRILGYQKVKLPTNSKHYWETVLLANSMLDSADKSELMQHKLILQKFNLYKIGYDIQLYFTTLGVATDFILEQYAYSSNSESQVRAEEGDTILDLGACWGDTALYFAYKAGIQGKVYSFEFIPENIKVFHSNVLMNPALGSRIELIPNPVSNCSGVEVHFMDNGPGSRIQVESFDGETGSALTISIDDFVKSKCIQKVDFIKMDIEGAEPLALEGAINTITRFKPKLAIAIYHSLDDFVNIPAWIVGLNLDYKLFLGHYTIHSEETIIFAKVN